MITQRRIHALRLRARGQSYRAIAEEMTVTIQRSYQLVRAAAADIAGFPKHELFSEAISVMQERDPSFQPSTLQGLSKRAKAIAEQLGGPDEMPERSPFEVIRLKSCGRKTFTELTTWLRARGRDWTWDDDSRQWFPKQAPLEGHQ